MGGPIAMERKGHEMIGCPDDKHSHYVTSRQRILLGTGWLKMSMFQSTRQVPNWILWYLQDKILKAIILYKRYFLTSVTMEVTVSCQHIHGGKLGQYLLPIYLMKTALTWFKLQKPQISFQILKGSFDIGMEFRFVLLDPYTCYSFALMSSHSKLFYHFYPRLVLAFRYCCCLHLCVCV